MSANVLSQESAAATLQKMRPTLYAEIERLIKSGKTAANVDEFLGVRMKLPKGNTIRDLVFFTAQYIEQKRKAN